MIADFISPIAGSYIAQDLGWRCSILLAAIVFGFFSFLLLVVYRETYAVIILKRKAKRLQKESTDGRQYRSKHQVRVDATTIIESVMKPLHILIQSPILMLTTSYMTIKYVLVSFILAKITETMESTYPNVFSRGSIGLKFLSLAIGNTIAFIFYSLTPDRYMIHLQKKEGRSIRGGVAANTSTPCQNHSSHGRSNLRMVIGVSSSVHCTTYRNHCGGI